MIEVSQKELRLTLLRKNILKSAQKRANRRIIMINILLQIAGLIPAENKFVIIPILIARVFILSISIPSIIIWMGEIRKQMKKN